MHKIYDFLELTSSSPAWYYEVLLLMDRLLPLSLAAGKRLIEYSFYFSRVGNWEETDERSTRDGITYLVFIEELQ